MISSIECLTPGPVFDKIECWSSPSKVYLCEEAVAIKAYVCLFQSRQSTWNQSAFIAALRCFTAWRGKPSLTMVQTSPVPPKEIYDFLNERKTQGDISEGQCIEWRFIPERAPHSGALWDAVVKSIKFHFKRIVGNAKLTFEELTTILT